MAFFSPCKQLRKNSVNYTALEKECLVVVAALKHFVVNLLGGHFVIQIDQQAMKYLISMQNSNGNLTCWALAIHHSYLMTTIPTSLIEMVTVSLGRVGTTG